MDGTGIPRPHEGPWVVSLFFERTSGSNLRVNFTPGIGFFLAWLLGAEEEELNDKSPPTAHAVRAGLEAAGVVHEHDFCN